MDDNETLIASEVTIIQADFSFAFVVYSLHAEMENGLLEDVCCWCTDDNVIGVNAVFIDAKTVGDYSDTYAHWNNIIELGEGLLGAASHPSKVAG